MEKDEDEYEVGYKKPPKDKRFKRGQSGNPKGRPKADLSMRQLIKKLGSEKLAVDSERGRVKITAVELVLRQLRHQALKGDKTAIKQFTNMWLDSVGYGESDVTMRSLTEEDRAILRQALSEDGYGLAD
jgi:hypothetical protein